MFSSFSRRGRGRDSNNRQRGGRGLGDGTKPGSGPSGTCVCPKCGHKIRHVVGQRCMDIVCPNCGTAMVRA